MRKIFLNSVLFAAVTIMAVGCLKDKGFEDHKYGINDPDTQLPGVGFPLSTKPFHKNTVGVDLQANAQDVNDVVFINLLAGETSNSDVTVNLVINDALRKNYNASLPASSLEADSIWEMPSNLYNLAMTVTIPAGQRNAQIPINVINTMVLDPNNTYGIGITITGVSSGYGIAGNQKNLLVELTIKNQYHGEYQSEGYFYHPSAPRPQSELKDVLTSGLNSVDIYLGDLGGAGYVGRVTIDPATNKCTITAAPGAAGAPYTQFDTGLPTTSPGYTAQWSGSAQCNNTYDPATKTFYLRYGYMGGSGWRVTEEIIVRQ